MDPQPTSELNVLRDYLGALLAIQRARSIFVTLIILSLVMHIGAYVLCRWGNQLQEKLHEVTVTSPVPPIPDAIRGRGIPLIPSTLESESPATLPMGTTTRRTSSAPSSVPTSASSRPGIKTPPAMGAITPTARPLTATRPKLPERRMRTWIASALPLARLTGLAAATLLVLTCLIGVNICLAGRMGGIAQATSAFFWSIVLIALLVPWRHLVPGEAIELPDAFFDVHQLWQGLREPMDTPLIRVRHYARFIGCPVLAMLVSVACGVRLWLAYRQVKRAVEPLVPLRGL